MKKIDLGQTIGIRANLGVLGGILLLAYELNQNRQLTRAEIRNAIAENLATNLLNSANSPDLSEITLKALAGETLTPIEQNRFYAQEAARMRLWENIHYQYRNGLFDDSEYAAQLEVIRAVVNAPVERDIWCSRRSRQSANFVSDVDALLEDPCE